MMKRTDNRNKAKKKSFLAGLFEKLDKKMEEKSKSQPCCSKPTGTKGGSCCS
jgi:hypothetical protein